MVPGHVELVLASQSPRRRQLLEQLGLTFACEPADVNEDWYDDDDPIGYVERIAASKADAIAVQLGAPFGTVVLGADTTVDLDGEILAKPADDDDARRMLRALAGRTHHVHTAVVGWSADAVHDAIVTTEVTFAPLTDAEIDWYLSIGEHRDKAGAYGMQGAGGALVERIDGSPSNVIGLPLVETLRVLRACGFHLP